MQKVKFIVKFIYNSRSFHPLFLSQTGVYSVPSLCRGHNSEFEFLFRTLFHLWLLLNSGTCRSQSDCHNRNLSFASWGLFRVISELGAFLEVIDIRVVFLFSVSFKNHILYYLRQLKLVTCWLLWVVIMTQIRWSGADMLTRPNCLDADNTLSFLKFFLLLFLCFSLRFMHISKFKITDPSTWGRYYWQHVLRVNRFVLFALKKRLYDNFATSLHSISSLALIPVESFRRYNLWGLEWRNRMLCLDSLFLYRVLTRYDRKDIGTSEGGEFVFGILFITAKSTLCQIPFTRIWRGFWKFWFLYKVWWRFLLANSF